MTYNLSFKGVGLRLDAGWIHSNFGLAGKSSANPITRLPIVRPQSFYSTGGENHTTSGKGFELKLKYKRFAASYLMAKTDISGNNAQFFYTRLTKPYRDFYHVDMSFYEPSTSYNMSIRPFEKSAFLIKFGRSSLRFKFQADFSIPQFFTIPKTDDETKTHYDFLSAEHYMGRWYFATELMRVTQKNKDGRIGRAQNHTLSYQANRKLMLYSNFNSVENYLQKRETVFISDDPLNDFLQTFTFRFERLSRDATYWRDFALGIKYKIARKTNLRLEYHWRQGGLVLPRQAEFDGKDEAKQYTVAASIVKEF